jgi:hypothetical protein
MVAASQDCGSEPGSGDSRPFATDLLAEPSDVYFTGTMEKKCQQESIDTIPSL